MCRLNYMYVGRVFVNTLILSERPFIIIKATHTMTVDKGAFCLPGVQCVGRAYCNTRLNEILIYSVIDRINTTTKT